MSRNVEQDFEITINNLQLLGATRGGENVKKKTHSWMTD